ncbi:hypothetical protein [Paenibacillus sp. NEAU-GSW1]|uniref:hypothetical protein n=1 Tax=Paenibacillus sp. NEAU-GSW1 TaxID=2682486 RepID=UPI0012E11DB0|nr:hypothetical protein [Paenibacillus sp. NEAU-GSW1]MUT68508.1 hypothetical protein [Paenibacillus sp. NEAU-GSW1]
MSYGQGHKKSHKKGSSITYNYYYNIYNNIHIEQRAEGGGQINKNVGQNSNQGGQSAFKSRTGNKFANFANGNGRSGLAGKKNDEIGGQESKKINVNIKKGGKGKKRYPRR